MGRRVGDYELFDTLGTGAFAKVKKAKHVQTGKTYAVKILDVKKYKTKEKTEWVRREIAVMKRLEHPNIVKLHQVLNVSEKLHLVLELVEGGDLLTVISKNKKLLEAEARAYFRQLISAVQYIHQMGICHRDLKPENLLVTDRNVLKVADFGLSSIVSRSEQTNEFQLLTTIVGSPDYCAPEVVMEKSYDGFKADVYSCGTILYTMVTGRRPFESRDESATLQKVREGTFMVPRHVSKDCDSLINGLMKLNPDERLSMDAILAHPWVNLDYAGEALVSPAHKNIRDSLTMQDLEDSIQEIKMTRVTGNAFSLIAGLQVGGVDALVGGESDVKLLLTCKQGDTQAVFLQIADLLKRLGCRVQAREGSSVEAGKMVLFNYIMVEDQMTTFLAEMQSVPPQLVALTLRMERGVRGQFSLLCNAVAEHLSDLLTSHQWDVVTRVPDPSTPASAPALDPASLCVALHAVTPPTSPLPASPPTPEKERGASFERPQLAFQLRVTQQGREGEEDQFVAAAAKRVQAMLVALHTSPVLLRASVRDSKGREVQDDGSGVKKRYRVSGFAPSGDQRSLFTFKVDFESTRETDTGRVCTGTARALLGSEAVFRELQTALSQMCTKDA